MNELFERGRAVKDAHKHDCFITFGMSRQKVSPVDFDLKSHSIKTALKLLNSARGELICIRWKFRVSNGHIENH